MRVLDENGETIELKTDDDDDYQSVMRDTSVYRSDDSEIESSGYTIEDVEDPDSDFTDEDSEEADMYASKLTIGEEEDE